MKNVCVMDMTGVTRDPARAVWAIKISRVCSRGGGGRGGGGVLYKNAI